MMMSDFGWMVMMVEVEDDGERKIWEMGINHRHNVGLDVVDWIGGEG